MSRHNRGQNLSEWADLVGASLPDSVEDLDDVGGSVDAYVETETGEPFGYEFGDGERKG
ncbi:hypothetical protein [Halobellus marinus]|jgi:hypothetical protein|uniref:hypothetical protein n=1 Tax=Halobellus TaxID=1073986 RepID=UPI0028AC2EB9|nr:hypothetical protein [Halobellus sp. DFY28]